MGPLEGVRIIELGGIGAAPFCAMLFADMGAEVLRIDRIEPADTGLQEMDPKFYLLNRGRRSVAMDLKNPEALATLKRLIPSADAIIEGFRPGVCERMGLGPDDCFAINPKLVFGRLTGWGQSGPLAMAPGRDLNYIALSGALHPIGSKDGPPVPPLNLVGDFGGGALYLAFGVVCAILEARGSGRGQVVDAAMVDGSASLMTLIHGFIAAGMWSNERGSNRLDGSVPWYGVYQTRDARYVTIASNESKFYKRMLELMGLDENQLPSRDDRSQWSVLRARFAEAFRQKTRDEWCEVMGDQVCFAPVLSPTEAPLHPHNQARGTFVEVDGIVQPAPAPRFSRTKLEIRYGAPTRGGHDANTLLRWGLSAAEIAALLTSGAVA